MDDHALQVLDFIAVREMLVERAVTPLGKARCRALRPVPDPELVERRQAETAEARRLLVVDPPLSLAGVGDVREAVWWTQYWPERGAALRPVALRAIAAASAVARRAQAFLLSHAGPAPLLAGYAAGIGECAGLEAAIDAAITAKGEVADAASPALARLRDAARAAAGEARGPLIAAAEAERERILQALTGQVKAVAGGLLQTLDVLGEVDAIFARGSLGLEMRGERPLISRTGQLSLRAARHPLLGGRVVPIDVQLGQAFDMLLITGPNTGGKTVTLKTVGLFCLMAQAGLQIPAAAGSTVPVYPQVFADLGDEQSIEQDLSTFSSHLSQIVRILDRVVPGALVLLDELGAGTDPAEGAALATVILEQLQARQAQVMATTHYPELKAFALAHTRAENAAMAFDVQTLRPTYRLEIGAVGASQAFAIALRLGLDPALVERAGRLLPHREASEG